MKTQRKFDIITVVLSLVTGLLLYIKIVDYYQLSNLWVNHSDARLHHFILMLWLLVAGLILSILLWFYFRSKDAGTKPWIGFGILLVTLFGSFYQYTHAPNYQSYHETPYPISATAVEKRVNSKSYDLYNDGPIYFYRKNDHSYPKVRKLIRQYSLAQQNDLDCIDMATLKKSLGQKRYAVVIKNAKISSRSAIFLKYSNEDGGISRITFNNLQKSHNLNFALNFIDNH